jgi:hypothetical protein
MRYRPAMPLILRRANVSRISGAWNDDDYDVYDGDRDVGRIFRQADGSWFWGVSFMLTKCKSYGHAASFEDAKAAFRAEHQRWQMGRPQS